MFWLLIRLPVPGHPGLFIQADGTLWSCRFGVMRRRKAYIKKPDGYPAFADYSIEKQARRTFLVHRLLLLAFRGDRPGMVARHLDGNPANNRIDNLSWGTHEENMQDMVMHGTSTRGEKNHHAKITEQQVIEIKQSPLNNKQIAAQYGITHSLVSLIRLGRAWSHVAPELSREPLFKRKRKEATIMHQAPIE